MGNWVLGTNGRSHPGNRVQSLMECPKKENRVTGGTREGTWSTRCAQMVLYVKDDDCSSCFSRWRWWLRWRVWEVVVGVVWDRMNSSSSSSSTENVLIPVRYRVAYLDNGNMKCHVLKSMRLSSSIGRHEEILHVDAFLLLPAPHSYLQRECFVVQDRFFFPLLK